MNWASYLTIMLAVQVYNYYALCFADIVLQLWYVETFVYYRTFNMQISKRIFQT